MSRTKPKILAIMADGRPRTDEEIVCALEVRFSHTLKLSSLRDRRRELAADGRLMPFGKRRKSGVGRKAVVWALKQQEAA